VHDPKAITLRGPTAKTADLSSQEKRRTSVLSLHRKSGIVALYFILGIVFDL